MGIREVHMSDLIRAHEGNAESNPDYPNKIHWGKFNMIGKFVHGTTLCQVQCRSTQDYNFTENLHIKKLMQQNVMDVEVCAPLPPKAGSADEASQMQKSRIAPPPDELFEEPNRLHMPRTYSRDAAGSGQHKDPSNIVRKLFQW
jgi:hypothetical protein